MSQSTIPLRAAMRAVDATETALEAPAAATAQAVSDAAEKAVKDATEIDAHFNAWLIRVAGALNQTATAMRHGGHDEWTTGHVRKLLDIIRSSDEIASGIDDGGIVPIGFGPMTRIANAKAFIAAMGAAAR